VQLISNHLVPSLFGGSKREWRRSRANLFRELLRVGEKGLDARAASTRRRPGGPVEHGVVDLSMTDELRLWPPLRRGQVPLNLGR
jgi:hypothetical protein